MSEWSGQSQLRQTMSRMDDAELLLLKPQRSGLGALAENLEASWRDLCAMELAVRGGADTIGWRGEFAELRARVRRVAILLEHARGIVGGCQIARSGAYGEDGIGTAPGKSIALRLDEEG